MVAKTATVYSIFIYQTPSYLLSSGHR